MRPILPVVALIVGCAPISSGAQATTPDKTAQQAAQAAAPQVPGPVPPRDARLQAPKTQDTVIPPNITSPPPTSPTPGVPQRPLSVDEAVHLALRFQPSILNARAGLYAQKGRTRQVRAGLMPQGIVNGSYTRVTTINGIPFSGSSTPGPAGTSSSGVTSTNTGGTTPGGASTSTTTSSTTTSTTTAAPSIGVIPGADIEGTLKQLIFDFNHTRDMVSQSRALERAADQTINQAVYDTAFQVKQAFYQYVQNIHLAQVNEQEVANRQAQLDLALSRYNVGLGEPVDVYTAQTAKAEAILNLQVARDNVEQARISLALAIGIDPLTPIQPADSVEAPVVGDDVNALVAQSLKQRPEAIQAQETLRSTKYAVKAAKSTNAPIIAGEVNVVSLGDQFVPQNDYLTVGITFSWNPLDGGLMKGRVDEAKANVLAAESQLNAIQLSIKADVDSAYINMRNSEGRVAAAQADVTNATENVKVAEERYRTGIGQFVDIINAQAFLLTARINLVTTLALIPQYRAALARAIGTKFTP